MIFRFLRNLFQRRPPPSLFHNVVGLHIDRATPSTTKRSRAL